MCWSASNKHEKACTENDLFFAGSFHDFLLHLLLLAHHSGAAGEAASCAVTLCHTYVSPYFIIIILY